MAENLGKIILQGGEGEITEKRSRFIASVRFVDSEAEALAFIEGKKKEHWDARHNCYAYIIGMHRECMRCSDDGEPAQTAGRPMLDVLQKERMINAAVVVTRYFGGVLLGTGGLVRAYQLAVQTGLQHCRTADVEYGRQMRIATDYSGLGRITHLLREMGTAPEDVAYGAGVEIAVTLPEDLAAVVERRVTDATQGEAVISLGEPVLYARDGKLVRFLSKPLRRPQDVTE